MALPVCISYTTYPVRVMSGSTSRPRLLAWQPVIEMFAAALADSDCGCWKNAKCAHSIFITSPLRLHLDTSLERHIFPWPCDRYPTNALNVHTRCLQKNPPPGLLGQFWLTQLLLYSVHSPSVTLLLFGQLLSLHPSPT